MPADAELVRDAGTLAGEAMTDGAGWRLGVEVVGVVGGGGGEVLELGLRCCRLGFGCGELLLQTQSGGRKGLNDRGGRESVGVLRLRAAPSAQDDGIF